MERGSRLLLMTCGLALTAVGLAGLDGCRRKPVLTPQQQAGRRLYQGRCAHCHEDNDLGLKKVPPSLARLFERTALPSGAPATDAEVERVVVAGKGLMPGFQGRFDREQMDALVAYLHAGVQK
jgi:mono/diheme cytochrome c family protein